MAWSLARKVAITLLVILLGTMVVTAFFTTSKLSSVLSSLVQSRYGVQVYAIKRNVEDRLALGFPLRQLRPVQDAIEREKADDSHIQDIEIFDAKGEILFDTDRGAIGSVVPEGWRAVSDSNGGQPFAVEDDESRLVGLPLVNSLGQVEGGVVLRYPGAYLGGEMEPVMHRLLREAAVLLALFSLVAVIGAYALFRPVGRRLAAMETRLAQVIAAGGDAPLATENGDSFEAGFVAFAGKTREVMDHVREASQDVERLDRLTGGSP